MVPPPLKNGMNIEKISFFKAYPPLYFSAISRIAPLVYIYMRDHVSWVRNNLISDLTFFISITNISQLFAYFLDESGKAERCQMSSLKQQVQRIETELVRAQETIALLRERETTLTDRWAVIFLQPPIGVKTGRVKTPPLPQLRDGPPPPTQCIFFCFFSSVF